MGRDSVRAMLLTSTRANPQAAVDALPDYDIIMVVPDIRSYYDDRSWLGDFGKVLTTYWDPIYQSPETGIEVFGNVVQYASGLKSGVHWLRVNYSQQASAGCNLLSPSGKVRDHLL